jgi:glycosyltransferase involved in cell wall biosynthesis
MITAPWAEQLGGAESMLYTLLAHLNRERLNPKAVLLAEGPLKEQLTALDVPTRTVPAGRLRQWRAFGQTVKRLVDIFRNETPDLILNWTSKSQLYGGTAALLSARADRVVWWQHGNPTGHWLDRAATALPGGILCCSERSAAGQRAMYPQRSLRVVYPGADRPREPSLEERRALRRTLGIPQDVLLIGIVGRLQAWKGQDRFVRALDKIRRRCGDVRGLIVGGDAYGLSPDYERELDRLIADLHLGDAVTRTGQVPDPSPFMALLDILVSASDDEPFGIVLLEAMALGVPVVAVASGGPLEILANGRFGALAASREPGDLVRAIEPLVRDPDLRASLAQHGRFRFERDFTADAAARRFEHALLSLCAKGRGDRDRWSV